MGSSEAMLEEIIRLNEQVRDLSFEHYFTYQLFSWVWWLNIAMLIVPLIVWWRTVDKTRLLEICVVGLLMCISAAILDVTGTEYVLWDYGVKVVPRAALLLPVDYVILPVILMHVYQNYSTWGKYLIAAVVVALLKSFVAEPLAVLIGQYRLIRWEYIYSVPIYIALYIIIKFMLERFKKVQNIALEKSNKSDEQPDKKA